MKKLLALFILLTLFTGLYAKDQKNDKPVKVKMSNLDKPPYYEEDPFAIFKYIEEEFKEPEGAIRKEYQEHVILKFILGSNGKLRDIKVTYGDKGTDPLLLEEIIKLLENTHAWSPAVYKGEKVAMYCTLGIDIPFMKIEAKFPGGQDSLNNFIGKELGYMDVTEPKDTAILSFTINENGDVSDVEVKKGINPELDDRAINILRKMPKWIPAKSNGINTRSKYTLPLVMQMQIGISETQLEDFITDASKRVEGNMPDDFPQYVGGIESLHLFISGHIKYPVLAQEGGISGIVKLKLTITQEGDIGQIEVVQKVHPTLDREAVSVVKKMPRWISAKKNGKPIESFFILPISFRL